MNIGVFCGSASGHNPIFSKTAKELGDLIGRNRHTLIYGGGNIGLMGILADQVMISGGKVIGVIPDFLVQREVGHTGVHELIQVKSMHERKQKMASLADVFVAMAGGWGTLDELAEILTWCQLGILDKPVGILNTDGFFSPLVEMMNRMVMHGFLKEENLGKLVRASSPESILTALGVEWG